ncbi:hypothetical protein L202_05888 [Cryptococcus amylolentus CBS 6039]|uniref:NADP-dependent oxidoreductase domain-containing protein n=2 Tax=Cryptococcus amylolentus TaxID=104669 RepID=A0A1E3HHR9_9TREE|nr:hypothetical protein L202_05888 [Cryptococcus amylolentus CBS 6039]ODN75902.1 hypothetical protein L202_05888 [Cryptococcus amylolentus CBS 6039]ODN97045.1 hypothetical protein I350_08024 [Cryptococcus amylolentus CBS 6273]
MAPATTFTLNDGRKIPSIGLGTWQSEPGQVAKAVESALKSGYRHIDAAWAYGNEKEVGQGIKASGVPREEIWVTSKLFELHHHPEHVELAVRDTLKNLGLEYLDLYLMHWNIGLQVDAPEGTLPQQEHVPKGKDNKPKLDVAISDDPSSTWKALENLVEKGLVKSIGVSNFNINRLEKLLKTAKIQPVADQVELSIQSPQPELVAYLKSKNILPQGYSPLGGTGKTNLRENKAVEKLANKYGVQTSNILLSWLVERGVNPVPKSVTPERIANNIKLVDLSKEDFEALEQLAESTPNSRVCDQSDSFDPTYDIFQENDPEFSDKAQFAKLGLKL